MWYVDIQDNLGKVWTQGPFTSKEEAILAIETLPPSYIAMVYSDQDKK